MKRLLPFFFILSSASAADISGNIGAIYNQSNHKGPIYTRPFANLAIDGEISEYQFKSAFRAFSDIAQDFHQDRLEVRELYATLQTDTWDHRIGAQLISFSETFGVQILDVANPRDYTDFIINDLNWSKLPTWAINSTYTHDNSSLQLIYAPYGGKDILPVKHSEFDVVSEQGQNYSSNVGKREFIRDSEYGLRLGHLLENGVDLNVLYYHHFNRVPTLVFKDLVFRPDYGEVNSLGMSFSYVLNDVVFRGDTLFTMDDYNSKGLGREKVDRLQYIYGVDYSWEGKWTLGYQVQYRQWPGLYWNSVFIQNKINDFWQIDFFSFVGLNNDDLWYRPSVTYRWIDFSITTQLDIITASSSRAGIFTPYGEKDRLYTNFTYQY